MTGAGALGQLLSLTNVCNPGWYPPHGSVGQAHIVLTFLQTLVSDKLASFNYTVDVETQDGTATGTQDCYINSTYSSPTYVIYVRLSCIIA